MIKYYGLTKAEVLSILYNNAKAKGLGVLLFELGDMTVDQAEKLLKQNTSFNYIKGRALLIDLTDDEFDETQYNQINGDFAAQNAIKEYLKNKENSKVV